MCNVIGVPPDGLANIFHFYSSTNPASWLPNDNHVRSPHVFQLTALNISDLLSGAMISVWQCSNFNCLCLLAYLYIHGIFFSQSSLYLSPIIPHILKSYHGSRPSVLHPWDPAFQSRIKTRWWSWHWPCWPRYSSPHSVSGTSQVLNKYLLNRSCSEDYVIVY